MNKIELIYFLLQKLNTRYNLKIKSQIELELKANINTQTTHKIEGKHYKIYLPFINYQKFINKIKKSKKIKENIDLAGLDFVIENEILYSISIIYHTESNIKEQYFPLI